MSDIIVTEQAAPASPAATKHAVYVDSTTKKLASKDSAGAVTNYGASSGSGDKYPLEARLTLETGVAVSTTSQTAKTTLYLTPYLGNQIATYSGTAWSVLALAADLSLDISAYTASKNYDIWVYNNAGTLTLDSTIWTNDSTRATALALQDGVYVKAGDATRRYVGTIRITGTTGQCEDSVTLRGVWNCYNRTVRPMQVLEATNSWAYTTATWRSANGSTANRLQFVIGVSEDNVKAQVDIKAISSAGVIVASGIALDATNTSNAQLMGAYIGTVAAISVPCAYQAMIPAGFHFLQWTEYSVATGTTTWYSDNNIPQYYQSGIIGEVRC